MMSKQNLWLIGGVMVIIAVITVGVRVGKKTLPPENQLVGVALLPLTGGASEFGEDQKAGIEIALNQINSAGGVKGRTIKIIFEDSRNDPKEAVSALNKLILTHKPCFILTTMSSVTLAIAPLIDKYRIPTLSIAANPNIIRVSKYIFRTLPAAGPQGELLAEYLKQKNLLDRVALLYVNDDFGAGYRLGFEAAMVKVGGNISMRETFEKKAMDYRQQISKVLKTQPKAIVLFGYEQNLVVILKQLREARFKGHILGSIELGYPKVLSNAREAAEGIVFPALKFTSHHIRNERVKQITDFIKSKYGKEPSLDAFIAYDEVYMIAHAANVYGFGSEQIYQGLLKLKDFPGVTGILSMSPSREVSYPLTLNTVRNGRVILIQKENSL